ncbi:MAG: cytochrome c3 family protein [Deltaproteobacteria bacterium]|nr:cytochrome c3 family protein [Deltaproteobacteria bacterium]
MAVIFPRWTNKIPLILGGAVPMGGIVVVAAVWYWGSPKYTDVGYQPEQPVAFSHQQHAGELGMDCRYCHSTVERGAFAAIPPTQTCMNCHATIRKDSPKLAPVRQSAATGKPIEWVRVHMLPDYAYFDHSVHLAAGVGCASCHGRIDQMPVVRQDQSLSMGWCLECHRNPTPHLRPKGQITNMAYSPAEAKYDAAKDPQRTRTLKPPVYCSGCHR